MKTEIQTAANFLANLLRLRCEPHTLSLPQFRSRLEALLATRYATHWFPSSPNKGSGYRCIRINHKMDPILLKAGAECGLSERSLRELFPDELTLWIDPQEVSYRIGEDGSVCVLYEAKELRKVVEMVTPPPSKGSRIRRDTDGSTTSSSEEDSCSPMSMSPPSPAFDRSCKNSTWDNLIMDPNNGFEMSTFVAS